MCYCTAELLSSRGRSSSVNPFSHNSRQINAKFAGKVPFHQISFRPFFVCFQNFTFLIFLRFCFRFRSHGIIWEKKLQTTSSLEVHKFMHTCSLYQSCIKIKEISNLDFCHFFTIYVNLYSVNMPVLTNDTKICFSNVQ